MNLIYIDQNIVGLAVEDLIHPLNEEFTYWVYSRVHFDEISRTENPEKYLSALETIDAKYIELQLDDRFQLTNSASLNLKNSPTELYANYRENLSKNIDSVANIFNPQIAWANGAKCSEELRNLPINLSNALGQLLQDNPFSQFVSPQMKDIMDGYQEMVDEMLKQPNDYLVIREALGNVKASFNNIDSGKDIILRLWKKIVASRPSTTEHLNIDQFFGFEALPKSKTSSDVEPYFLKIVACCAVMDSIGFQAEKKARILTQIPNVMSDAVHIAMGASCTALVSNDRRLRIRANAIYEYLRIPVPIFSMERKDSGSIELCSHWPNEI